MLGQKLHLASLIVWMLASIILFNNFAEITATTNNYNAKNPPAALNCEGVVRSPDGTTMRMHFHSAILLLTQMKHRLKLKM